MNFAQWLFERHIQKVIERFSTMDTGGVIVTVDRYERLPVRKIASVVLVMPWKEDLLEETYDFYLLFIEEDSWSARREAFALAREVVKRLRDAGIVVKPPFPERAFVEDWEIEDIKGLDDNLLWRKRQSEG